jgi:hypothetical protein
MPRKKNINSTPGDKLLRLFRLLLLDGRKHYQKQLSQIFDCSPQTIIRLASEIEEIIGGILVKGLDSHKRWYQIKSLNPYSIGMEHAAIRYLSVCRDLASNILSEEELSKIAKDLMALSLLLAEYKESSESSKNYLFDGRGYIDYSGKAEIIERLLRAQEEKKLCLVSFREEDKSEFREHNFAPGRMLALNNVLYSLGADLSENGEHIEYTNFAIHKIELVSVLDKLHSQDFPKFVPANFGFQWGAPRTYQIKFKAGKSASYVSERVWSENQALKRLPEGDLVLTLTTSCESEIECWMRSFGSDCSLVSVSGIDRDGFEG